MTLEQNKTTGERIACILIPAAERENAVALAEACIRFTPRVALRGDEAVFLEISGSRKLFSEEGFVLRARALCGRFWKSRSVPRIAVAADAASALALARFGGSDPRVLPLDALLDFASPFEPPGENPERTKKLQKLIATIRVLGLRNLAQFAILPTRTLASRFGQDGVELSSRLRLGFSEPWPLFQPAERIEEHALVGDPETMSSFHTLEPLLFSLKELIDRALARLRGRALRASVIELELRLEFKKPARHWTLQLPIPQGTVSGLLPLVRERVGGDLQRRPLEAGVSEIFFRVSESAPGLAAQRDFFNRRENEAEAWDALVARITMRLGPSRAFIAAPVDRHLPEGAWKPLQASEKAAAPLAGERVEDSAPMRPSRLLKNPERLRREGDTLVAPGKRWRALEWHGPERMSGEWWLDPKRQGFQRDYYRVVTASGEQLWVYAAGDFFLHGYFD